MFYKGKESLLKKSIKAMDLTILGLGNILGPQAFVMISGLILLSGTNGFISLVICAILAFLISLIYSELALSMPVAGVVVNSVSDAYGAFPSFLVGWSQLLSNITYAAFCALAFGIIIKNPLIGAFLIIGLATIFQLTGLVQLERVMKIFVTGILLFFIVIIIFNFPLATNLGEISFSFGEFRYILFGVGFFFLSFTGFEDLATFAEEIKDVKKLPKAMFTTIFVVFLIYGLLYLLLLGGINSGDEMIKTEPILYLSQHIFGNYTSLVIDFVAILAIMSSLLPAITASSRDLLSMAEKGFLPKKLYQVDSSGNPILSVLLVVSMILLLVMIQNLDILIYLTNFVYFFVVLIVTLSMVKLREKRKKLDRPFKVWFFPILPLFVAYSMISLMFFLNLKSIGYGFMWLFFGFIVYMFKIVGSHRIKMAALGGYLISAFFIILLFLMFIYLTPDFSHFAKTIFIILILIIGLFFLLFKDIISERKPLFPNK